MTKKTILRFGRPRDGRSRHSTDPSPTQGTKKPTKKTPCAERTFLCSAVVAALFFIGALWGAPVNEAQSEAPREAIPVMATPTEQTTEESVREILRKNIRDVSGEPFGYLDGQWNLWEYLGDVMAELLLGG